MPGTKKTKGLPSMKLNRFRGYRFRRYAFATNLVGAGWLIVSAVIFIENPQWLTFAAAICSAFLSIPAFVIAAALTEIAEREFKLLKGQA